MEKASSENSNKSIVSFSQATVKLQGVEIT